MRRYGRVYVAERELLEGGRGVCRLKFLLRRGSSRNGLWELYVLSILRAVVLALLELEFLRDLYTRNSLQSI